MPKIEIHGDEVGWHIIDATSDLGSVVFSTLGEARRYLERLGDAMGCTYDVTVTGHVPRQRRPVPIVRTRNAS